MSKLVEQAGWLAKESIPKRARVLSKHYSVPAYGPG